MAKIVGSGAVRVFPVMTGFKKSVSKEMSASGKAGGQSFTASMKGAGGKAGAQLGKELGATAKTAMKGVGDDTVKQLGRDVADASAAMSKARMRQQTATAAAIQAENAYTTAVQRYGAQSAQARAAEQRLAAARERVKLADIQLTAATGNLKDAQQTLAAVQEDLEAKNRKLSDSLKGVISDFQTGFQNTERAKSSFANLSVALGGLTRTITGPAISALDRFKAGFTGMAKPIDQNTERAKSSFANLSVALGGLTRTITGPAISALDRFKAGFTGMAKPIDIGLDAVTRFGANVRDAMTSAANSIKGLAGKAANLAKPVTELAAQFRLGFTGMAKPIDLGLNAMTRFGAGVRNAMTTATNAIGKVTGTISGIANRIAAGMAKPIDLGLNAMTRFGAGVRNAMTTATNAIGKVTGTISGIANRIAAPFKPVAATIGNYLKGVGDSARTVFDNMSPIAKTAATGIANAFKSGAAQVKNAINGIGNAIKNIATIGVTGAAAGIGALAGKIVSMVPSAIEASDATDKFKSTLNFAGLDTGTIDALTASTQEYADKTVYDLSDIQSVTAQLAANSVPDFDKLAEAAGNLNAVAGGNKETFKSVGMVLTQTAGQGKLTTENWNQLADAIPGASGKLQEAMLKNGAFTGNFRDAMEKGEISADEFNKALMDLGMTDVARQAATATTTFEGAWGNFEAAITGGLKRIIDAFKPFATGAINTLTSGLTAAFDTIGGLAEKIAAGIGPAFDGIKDKIGGLTGVIAPLGAALGVLGAGGLGGLLTKLPVIGTAFSSMASGGGLLAKVLGALTGPIGMVVAAIGALIATSPQLRSQFGDMLTQVLATLQPMFAQIVPLIQQVGATLQTAIAAVMPVIVQTIGQLIPVIGQIMTTLGQLVATVLPPVLQVVNAIIPIITMLISTLLPPLTQVIQAVVPIIMQVVTAIGQIITTIASALVPIIQQLTPIIQTIATMAAGFITGILLPAFQAIAPVVQSAVGVIQSIFGTITGIIQGVVSIVSGIFTGDWTAIWNGFTTIVSSAVNGIGSIIGGIKDTIVNALSGAGTWLVESGKSIINGLVSGIKSAIGGAVDIVGGALQSIRDLFPFSPAKKGPFSGRGWVLYSGRSIPTAFAQGVEDNAGKAETAVRDAMSRAQQAADNVRLAYTTVATPTRMTTTATPPATTGDNGTNVTIDIDARGMNPDDMFNVLNLRAQRAASGWGG